MADNIVLTCFGSNLRLAFDGSHAGALYTVIFVARSQYGNTTQSWFWRGFAEPVKTKSILRSWNSGLNKGGSPLKPRPKGFKSSSKRIIAPRKLIRKVSKDGTI